MRYLLFLLWLPALLVFYLSIHEENGVGDTVRHVAEAAYHHPSAPSALIGRRLGKANVYLPGS